MPSSPIIMSPSLGLPSPPASVDDVIRLWSYAEFARPGVEQLVERLAPSPAREAAGKAASRVWVWGRHHAVLTEVSEVLAYDDPRGWGGSPSDGRRGRGLAIRESAARLDGMLHRAPTTPPRRASPHDRYVDAWVEGDLPFDAYTYVATRIWAERDLAGRFAYVYDRRGIAELWIYAYLQSERADQGIGDRRRWRAHEARLAPRLVERVAEEYRVALDAVGVALRWDRSRQPLPPSSPVSTRPVSLRK